MQPVSQFTSSATGDHLAVNAGITGTDVYLGTSDGLHEIRLSSDQQAQQIAAWTVPMESKPCVLSAPTLLQPPDGGEIARGMVTLTWAAACNPSSYEVRVSGALVAMTTTPLYAFSPDAPHLRWQVTAIGMDGSRAESPIWSFDMATADWLATPAAAPASRLYAPPLFDWRSPGAIAAELCGALMLIVAAAWFIGRRADKRLKELQNRGRDY